MNWIVILHSIALTRMHLKKGFVSLKPNEIDDLDLAMKVHLIPFLFKVMRLHY